MPRVWEKIADKIKATAANNSSVKKKVGAWAKAEGLKHARACELGGDGSFPPMYGLADKLAFSNVKRLLGLDACKFGFTGAAPIMSETLAYYGSLGIQVNEVYGMSECTGATTFSTDQTHIWGSCGFAMPGTEVIVQAPDGSRVGPALDPLHPTEAEQGELCYRGRHVMMCAHCL